MAIIMTKTKLNLQKPVFSDVNYQLLSFKSPAGFNRKAIGQIYSILKEQVIEEQIFLSMNDLQNLFIERANKDRSYDDPKIERSFLMKNWLNKNQDEIDVDKQLNQGLEQIFSNNVKVLLNNEIMKSINLVELEGDKLVEQKKYFLNQTNNDLMNYGSTLSHEQARQYIFNSMDRYHYPFPHVLSKSDIYAKFIQNQYFEANHLLNSMISDGDIIIIPLIRDVYSGVDFYEDCLFPGRAFIEEINSFMDQHLIPTLYDRYPNLEPYIATHPTKQDYRPIRDDITREHRNFVYQYCFMILEARKSNDEISIEDMNLAQIIINAWLATEKDPLLALREYKVELDKDFLSPFMNQYINDFTHIESYLEGIGGFVQYLSRAIEHKHLINFFLSKGIQKQVVHAFLGHLPKGILSIKSQKRDYIICKSQIIPAIKYLVLGSFHKSASGGQSEFNALVQAFYAMEQSFKDVNQLIGELQITPDDYAQIKAMLRKSSFYKSLQKNKLESISSQPDSAKTSSPIPSKLIYSSKDFEAFDEDEKAKIINDCNLTVYECLDSQRHIHEIYLSKETMTVEDAKFFRALPTYELVCNRYKL